MFNPVGAQMSMIDRTETINSAVQCLAQGMSLEKTAKQVGIRGKGTIHKLAQKHKKSIELLALMLSAKSVQYCLDNHMLKLKTANEILRTGNKDDMVKYKDLLILADRCEYRALQIMGIAPSHTQSVVFNTVFNAQTTINNPQVLAVMQDYRSRQMEAVDIPDLALDGYDPTAIEVDDHG